MFSRSTIMAVNYGLLKLASYSNHDNIKFTKSEMIFTNKIISRINKKLRLVKSIYNHVIWFSLIKSMGGEKVSRGSVRFVSVRTRIKFADHEKK